MKKSTLFIFALISSLQLMGQQYMTQSGIITFFSEAPLENIEAVNNQVSGVIDMSTGQMQVQLLVNAFSFDKALMQQHFNERYLESHTYPKSKFEGIIQNAEQISLTANPQEVIVKGQLTLHGVTKDIETTATLQKTDDGQLHGDCTFFVNLDDYEVEVPSGVRKKVAEDIEVRIDLDMDKVE